ncbi:MAG: hypothetical protein U0457_11750 [Candidatus Sericytochromatia bacterium]
MIDCPSILEKIKETEPTAYHILASSYIRNNIAHAYIFSGKNTEKVDEIVKIFSKILLCKSETGEDNCINCKMMDNNQHPDYKIYKNQDEKSKVIKIDQIRELISDTLTSPITAKKKILFLQNAQQMQEASSNAVLKTLEEPTPFSIIILSVDSTENLLATIISRCQTIPIKSDGVQEKNILEVKKYLPKNYLHVTELAEELNALEKEEIKNFLISFQRSFWEKFKNSELSENKIKKISVLLEKIDKYIDCIDSYVNTKNITENFFIDLLEFANKR